MLGSTAQPDQAFLVLTMRSLTNDVDGALRTDRILICDRDRKWSLGVQRFLENAGVRVVRTPRLAPNCNAYAERFVGSIKEECLDRVVPLGERHLFDGSWANSSGIITPNKITKGSGTSSSSVNYRRAQEGGCIVISASADF